jgi:nicotinate-nucleotide adenylyltransferase
MAVALFFGSFNPVHVGHCIIAEAMLNQPGVEEVWLVVSPQNPLKKKATLLDQYHRLDLVRRAVEDTPGLRVSDIEFRLPLPSYTSHTLAYLAEMHPEREFSLIMGADTLATLPKWRAWEQILADHEILVYPRLDEHNQLVNPDPTLTEHPNVRLVDAPIVELSATEIRAALKEGRSVRHYLPAGLYEYIVRERFYG